MRYPSERKQRTKQKIISSAYKLFSSQGFAATSIDDIMRQSGLTRGGFYAHFKSKSHLYREAIHLATQQTGPSQQAPAHADYHWIDALLDEQSAAAANRDNDASRLAFLATDVASEVPEVRAAYTSAFKALSEKMLRIAAAHSANEDSILSATAMIVGALAIAQTTDDVELKTKLLAACKENAKVLLEEHAQQRSLSFFWEVETTRELQKTSVRN